ncbi:unnamed protein product [Sympodiomycopsis kandeliae]
MRFSSSLAVLSAWASLALLTVNACSDIDHEHGLSRRSSRYATQPSPGTALLRPITWGDFNVIHTTDIHGWYQGHLHSTNPEPNYSGDWGDFASFVAHMRRVAKQKGVDLLIVDSGDLHDGAGLSDGFPPGQVDGHVSNQFHSMIKYDLLSVGNHELYKYGVAYDTYKNFVPAQNGRYLSSNVNISIYDQAQGRNVSHIMGKRFAKYKTDQGKRITSFGVLFNFKGQDGGITIQDPKDMVKEAWFLDAIKERPDVFLLAGHMPVSRDEWPTVVSAIRAVHSDVPIMILGGHTHIRDCTTYDDNSVGLESGRYLETIGWLSANLTQSSQQSSQNNTKKLAFSRSYIDANRRNYAFHSGLTGNSNANFDTRKGIHITEAMAKIAGDWNLTEIYGVAPQDYYLDRVGIDSNSSLLNLLSNHVLPTVIAPSGPNDKPNIILMNSGSQRFDLYSGNFTRNDNFIVSPFTDAFLYLADVPYKYANQVLDDLNRRGAYSRRDAFVGDDQQKYEQGHIDDIYQQWRHAQYHLATDAEEQELDVRAAQSHGHDHHGHGHGHEDDTPTLGYVTKDSCPNTETADDTVHTPIPFVSVPDYIGSPVTGNSTAIGDNDTIDVIFVDFIVKDVVSILNSLQKDKVWKTQDAQEWGTLLTNDLLVKWAQKEWQSK